MNIANQKTAIVLFGATGDLASRNLFPAVYRLFRRRILSNGFFMLNTARSDLSRQEMQDHIRKSLDGQDPTQIDAFLDRMYYVKADVTVKEDFERLKETYVDLKDEYGEPDVTVYHFSVAPFLFGEIAKNLEASGMREVDAETRLIIEKPFGEDEESARDLNANITRYFDEDQIYRIDHYLGMEMVQNITAVRRFNPFIEGIWNSEFVKNVQVTLLEDQDIGDRGSYYDSYGAFLDMFQNHFLQIMAVVGSDLTSFEEGKTTSQLKTEFLKAIPEMSAEEVKAYTVRGQYTASPDGEFQNYTDEKGVEDDSKIDTFIAGRIRVENDRWTNVPFYFRHGKALDQTLATVSIVFRSYQLSDHENKLTFYIRPAEGLKITLNQKKFGEDVQRETFELEQPRSEADYMATEYENLIHDAVLGDHTFFVSDEEIYEQWRITDSIRRAWDELGDNDPILYEGGSKGPQEAYQMIQQDNSEWVDG